jgi:hypothetical protein
MMKKIFYSITGGRPMKLIKNHYFTDVFSGKMVNVYRNMNDNTLYMAIGPWSKFRVKTAFQMEELL